MQFLQIKSKGEMALEAISLIGASTKRGDPNSIGMFGSGLKYALASIMRQDIPFVIFSGEKEIRLSTKVVEFKGKQFNRIYINGTETSLTDSMGTEDWDGTFPFIREIYSNALDEDKDATIEMVDAPEIEEGYTIFCLEATPNITLLMSNFERYFLRPADAIEVINNRGEIHRKSDGIRIFRKGILAHHDKETKSIFSYNLEDLDINESRVVKNIYQARNKIAEMLESMTNKRNIRVWINTLSGGNAGYFEHTCILPDWYSTYANPELVEVLLENKYYPIETKELYEEDEMKGRISLPLALLKRFVQYAPDIDILGLNSSNDNEDDMYIECAPPERLFDKVADAVSLLKRTNYKHRLEHDIVYCKFIDSEILGKAENNKIMLSVKLDTYSVDEIAKIIIEEQEHLHSGFGDGTRNFQNHLFNLYFDELIRK